MRNEPKMREGFRVWHYSAGKIPKHGKIIGECTGLSDVWRVQMDGEAKFTLHTYNSLYGEGDMEEMLDTIEEDALDMLNLAKQWREEKL
jgi:hypothetical protein